MPLLCNCIIQWLHTYTYNCLLLPCHACGRSCFLWSFFTSENDSLCWYITNTETSTCKFSVYNLYIQFIPVLFIFTLQRSSISQCSHLYYTLFSISHTIISFTFTVSLLHFHIFTPFRQSIYANSKKHLLSVFCPTYYIKNLIQVGKENLVMYSLLNCSAAV